MSELPRWKCPSCGEREIREGMFECSDCQLKQAQAKLANSQHGIELMGYESAPTVSLENIGPYIRDGLVNGLALLGFMLTVGAISVAVIIADKFGH